METARFLEAVRLLSGYLGRSGGVVAIGITVGDATTRGAGFTVLSDKASRAMAYVGMALSR